MVWGRPDVTVDHPLRTTLVAALLALTVIVTGAVVHGSSASTATGDQLVATARSKIGSAYQWGGNGPNTFDCSGFIRYVLVSNGVDGVPRVSADQHRWATPVSRSNLRPGDLVFYRYSGRNGSGADHVKIYSGNGRNIGASSSKSQVVEAPIHDAAVLGYGRAPGVAQKATATAPSVKADPGWADGTTRAQAARTVADTLKLDDRRNPFGVKTEAGAVGAVYHARISFPYRDGLWRPNVPITGRQTVLWLDRADVTRGEAASIVAGILELDDRPNRFGIGGRHGGAVGALNEAGIAYPYRDGRFRPGRTISKFQLELWMDRAGAL